MNARQKAKKLKKENDLMRRIIADSPVMQELYDAYNKPMFVTHTTMQFQEYRVERMVPDYMGDLDWFIECSKQAIAKDLFEGIKENITYEINYKNIAPTITASIFVGRK